MTTDSPSKPAATDTSGMPLPNLKDACYVNAMIHFYRGELGRIMIWRQRLDVTTTWAITSTTSIITVAFSFPGVPHIVFFFNLAFVWMLLWIEARRYRFYDAFRGRVRMLESHFLVPMISQSPNLLAGEWRRLVCEDLILPSFKISKIEAVGRRLKRNYVFIFGIIMVGLDVEGLCPRQGADRFLWRILSLAVGSCAAGMVRMRHLFRDDSYGGGADHSRIAQFFRGSQRV